MKKTYPGILALLLGATSINASATPLLDKGSTTIDTHTSLEWLDISLTAGMSYGEVLTSSFVVQGGYRYAAEFEVQQLFADAGGTPTTHAAHLASNNAPARLLLDLMGCTSHLVGNPCDGVGEDWTPAMWGTSAHYVGLIDDHPGGGVLATRWVPFGNFRADVGSFLVRDAVQVSEPAALSLLAIGVLAMGAGRRTSLA